MAGVFPLLLPLYPHQRTPIPWPSVFIRYMQDGGRLSQHPKPHLEPSYPSSCSKRPLAIFAAETKGTGRGEMSGDRRADSQSPPARSFHGLLVEFEEFED